MTSNPKESAAPYAYSASAVTSREMQAKTPRICLGLHQYIRNLLIREDRGRSEAGRSEGCRKCSITVVQRTYKPGGGGTYVN